MIIVSNRTTQSSVRGLAAAAAVVLSSVAAGPFALATLASADPAPKPMSCAALAAFVTKQAGNQLNENPINPGGTSISSATPVTAAIVPAIPGPPPTSGVLPGSFSTRARDHD